MRTEARIAELEALVSQLRTQLEAALAHNQELTAQYQHLQERLAQATKDSHNSHNSSKPPSSDPLARKRVRSQRRRSGKKPGGQLGHAGETLHLVASPDEVVEHRPTVCTSCQTPLDETALVVRYERRQVHELPPMRLLICEQRALHVRCPNCAQVSVGTFPAAAPSRAQYGPHVRALAVYLLELQLIPYARVRDLLAELLGVHVSLGTLTRWVRQAATTLVPVEEQIKAALVRAPVLHSDETGVRRAGKLAWAHVTSTSRLTHYAIHAKRGREATDAIGILPTYQGVSVHDGWKPYRHYTQCRHALCNIHHLRELTFVEEQSHQVWASELKGLLLEMKAAVDQARARGDQKLPEAARQSLVAHYEDLLAAGRAANPPPERPPGKRGRVKQSPACNLLERLSLRQGEVLAFLDDLTIPFDNNQAEQDLRMLKVQQKVSGCFRSEWGADAYATIRSYLATLRKQGHALLDALDTAFTGSPLHPAFA